MKSIIFVCLGNICRSPIAEGIAKKIAKERDLEIKIDSAGTGDWHIDQAPCDNSIRVAKMHDIDISQYKGRQVTVEDFDKYDMVIGLDQSNMDNLKKLGCKKHIKLGSFGFNDEDVPDPYFFEGFEGFDKVFDMIDSCVRQLIDEEIDV